MRLNFVLQKTPVALLSVALVCGVSGMPSRANAQALPGLTGWMDDSVSASTSQLSRAPDSFFGRSSADDGYEVAPEEVNLTSSFFSVPDPDNLQFYRVTPGETDVPLATDTTGNQEDLQAVMRGPGAMLFNQLSLTGANTTYWSAFNLMESGLLGGVTQSLNQAQGMQNAARLANLESMAKAELFEESKPFIKAYIWCIQRMMLVPTVGMTEAVAMCRNDRPTGTQRTYMAGVGTGWTMAHDQAHPLMAKNSAMRASIGSALPIRLTLADMLFNNEGKLVTTPAAASAMMLWAEPRLLLTKNDFEAMFGNVEFSYIEVPGGLTPRQGRIVPIPASMDRGLAYTREIGAVMDRLGDLLTVYCGTASVTGAASFWEGLSGIQRASLAKISTPNQPFDQRVFNYFAGILADEPPAVGCLGLTFGGSLTVGTIPLSGWTGVLATVQSGATFGALPSGMVLDRPIVKEMYAYARQVGFFRFMMKAAVARHVVKGVSSGVLSDASVQRLALNLIEQTVPTQDPEAAAMRASEKLRAWVQTKIGLKQQDAERRGASFGDELALAREGANQPAQ